MFKTKKSKFVGFSIIVLVILACLSPLIIHYDSYFGIRHISRQTIINDISTHVSLTIEVDPSIAIQNFFIFHVNFEFFSNSSVTDMEVERINYQIYCNARLEESYHGNFNPPYIISRGIRLNYGDNTTFQGSLDLNYKLFDNPKNSTLVYDLIYTNNISEQDVLSYILLKYSIFWA
ncbi:MAG: hypothetical protein ACFE96_13530 [Candidatus Hermodarchaeota archaeon]